MPAVFLGHGSPMNAIEDNEFHRSWSELGLRLQRPRAVLCISAHWERRGVYVTAAPRPQTIHDFYGFPRALFEVQYPAQGDAALAARVAELLLGKRAQLDAGRGLDHGAWSVLRAMYPAADIPVLQLSLDTQLPGRWHYQLAGQLGALRDEGVLILGSGNIVHNLQLLDYASDRGFDWAVRVNEAMTARINARDHAALADYQDLDPEIRLAVPTPEHYLPLLYVLAVQRPGESGTLFNDRTIMGSLAMTSVVIGA